MKESSHNDSSLKNKELETSKILSPNASEKKRNRQKRKLKRKSSFSPNKNPNNQNSASLQGENLAKYLNSPDNQILKGSDILLGNSTKKLFAKKKMNQSRFI